MGTSLLAVNELTVDFKTKNGAITAVSDITLTLNPSETVCLVGESGSGKSVTSKAIMRLIDHENGEIVKGSITYSDIELTTLSTKQLNTIRGKKLAMIFQEPMAAFDPVYTIGEQLVETIRKHLKLTKKEAWGRGIDLLTKVGISDPNIRMRQYPNELSGGMLQRAMIAMALSCEPDVLIADEPTTALDVTIQAQILSLLRSLQQEFHMAILLITHDLGVASQVADRIVVMYAGQVVEQGLATDVFHHPKHPYTVGLLQSIPSNQQLNVGRLYSIKGAIPPLSDLPTGCRFHPRCPFATDQCKQEEPPLLPVDQQLSKCWHSQQIEQLISGEHTVEKQLLHNRTTKQTPKEVLLKIDRLQQHFPVKHSKQVVKAVNDVSFVIYKGETFGLVGESGSGKSTLGRSILQLYKPTAGAISFDNTNLTSLSTKKLREQRKYMQMIFQDPYGSLNPKWTIGELIAEPLKVHDKKLSKGERIQIVRDLLQKVGLNPDWITRYPHEFSGGQRQRIGIARAIAVNPDFILADEAVSALDVSVQAQVINLLKDLQEELGLTYLFIGHDLHIVRYISDRIGVMYLGKLVEVAPSDALFQEPLHPYTKGLIASIPSIEQEEQQEEPTLAGEIPSPLNPPTGCAFRTRCPFATERCAQEEPAFQQVQDGRFVACHYATQ